MAVQQAFALALKRPHSDRLAEAVAAAEKLNIGRLSALFPPIPCS